MPAIRALEEVAIIFEKFAWGPTGSVGFELASGEEVVTTTSDLDVLIRLSSYLSVKQAEMIVSKLKRCPVSVDVQVETEKEPFSSGIRKRRRDAASAYCIWSCLSKTESISIKDG